MAPVRLKYRIKQVAVKLTSNCFRPLLACSVKEMNLCFAATNQHIFTICTEHNVVDNVAEREIWMFDDEILLEIRTSSSTPI